MQIICCCGGSSGAAQECPGLRPHVVRVIWAVGGHACNLPTDFNKTVQPLPVPSAFYPRLCSATWRENAIQHVHFHFFPQHFRQELSNVPVGALGFLKGELSEHQRCSRSGCVRTSAMALGDETIHPRQGQTL